MAETAYIYDAVRTPRGKGRKDGSLHEVTALRLSETRMANLIASGGASLVGVFHLLTGMGIIGGPC